MADVVKKVAPDRSKILMNRDDEVKYWTKHLGIGRDELQRIVDKVGPSAAAIRKELGMQSELSATSRVAARRPKRIRLL
jgi:hypothetical protein